MDHLNLTNNFDSTLFTYQLTYIDKPIYSQKEELENQTSDLIKILEEVELELEEYNKTKRIQY